MTSDLPLDPALSAVAAELTQEQLGWAVAGGWAIDLFLGRLTRPHADVDIAAWRDEQDGLRRAMPAWDFFVADSGRLRQSPPTEVITSPLHELHARSPAGQSVEFLLNDRENGAWIYRRDAAVRLPLTHAIRHDGSFPLLAPEIVLLYKSNAPRVTDEEDFRHVLPRLSSEACAWLADGIARADAVHPWLSSLHAREV